MVNSLKEREAKIFFFSVKQTNQKMPFFFSAEHFKKYHGKCIHRPNLEAPIFHEKIHLNSTDDGAEFPSLSCLSLTWTFLDVMFPASSSVTGFCLLYLDTLCLFPFFIDIRKKVPS